MMFIFVLLSLVEFAYVPEAIEYINSNYNYWKAESEKIVNI